MNYVNSLSVSVPHTHVTGKFYLWILTIIHFIIPLRGNEIINNGFPKGGLPTGAHPLWQGCVGQRPHLNY